MSPFTISVESIRLARRTDPATSHEAAQRVQEFADSQCGKILASLIRKGPQTIDELAGNTDLTSVQIARRLKDLEVKGRAKPNGDERPGRAGRSQRVWRAV